MNLRISIVIGIIIVIAIFFYRYNYTLETKDEAKVGEYSESGNYVNITPMKHDIFKQLTLDGLVFFILWLMIEVIGGMESFFDWKDFFDLTSFTSFRLSIFGQSFFSILGFIVYYQVIEPHIINRTNKF
jgi:hypothetical protein